MKKYPLLYISFALIIVLGALHLVAEAFYFYWTIWWFDNMMHFLAGFAGGFFAIWFLFDSGFLYQRIPKTSEAIIGALLSVIVFGIAWEIFEYANDITNATEGYISDTTHDIWFDSLGAVFSGVLGVRKKFLSRI